MGAVTTRPPSIQLRRLATELARLRSEAGLTHEQVHEHTHMSRTTLGRIENAHVRPHLRSLAALLDLYDADEPTRTELLALHKAVDSGEDGWLSRNRDALSEEYSTYIQFENDARAISNFEGQGLPGLLQTEAYARAVIAAAALDELPADTLDKRVEARMKRQELLRQRPSVRLQFIIDEAVLRRAVGGQGVMMNQLERLIRDGELPNIALQVIPYDKGAHIGIPGSYVVLDFPEPNPSVVYMEHMGGGAFLSNQDDVQRFRRAFDRLTRVALEPEESLRMIAEIAHP